LPNEIGDDVKEILFFYPEQSAASFLNGRVLRRLTPDILFWCASEQNSADRPDPVCTATRQDVFMSLIKCGINPLAGLVSEHGKDKSKVLQSGLEFRSKRAVRRKSLLFVEADAAPNSETNPRETVDAFVRRAALLPDKRRVLVVDATVSFSRSRSLVNLTLFLSLLCFSPVYICSKTG